MLNIFGTANAFKCAQNLSLFSHTVHSHFAKAIHLKLPMPPILILFDNNGSGVAAYHFQDHGPCIEMYPGHRTCLSTGTMHTSGQCSRTSFTVICIDWMCRAANSVDVNLSAQPSPSIDPMYETVCRSTLLFKIGKSRIEMHTTSYRR